ncbi:MAG: hypothetical protein ACI4V2_03785 [Alloprevotella sp.]
MKASSLLSFALQPFPLIFGVSIEEEALDGAFFVGNQRLTAIRIEISGLIPATRGLMAENAGSHLFGNRSFMERKSHHSRRPEMVIARFSEIFVTSIPPI